MKNVDTNKVWRGKRKPEKLEMKGFSAPLPDEPDHNDENKDQENPHKTTKSTTKPRNRDTTIPRHHDTTTPRYHETIIEVVRKAVKEFGKEAATHRFTLDEKKAIAEIIYTYKKRSIRTSENEVTRIAVNFIIQDYREKKGRSVLDRTLKAINK